MSDLLVDWPDNLIRQIRDGRWVLFLGSGVAATCCNEAKNSPPTWEQLLASLAEGITDGSKQERAYELIGSRRFLAAAEHIRWCYRDAAKDTDFLNRVRDAVRGPADDPFQPSQVYAILLDLQPTIVVTTNYDRLFEIASRSAYDALCYYDASIASNVRKGQPILLKLHGRIDEMRQIVLTRQDYMRLRREGAHALETLRSLFHTHTVLFVGYSLEDPDVQLMLEAAGGDCDPEAHYLLSRSAYEPYEIETFRNFYGVSVLSYDSANGLEDVLADLRDLVVSDWQVEAS